MFHFASETVVPCLGYEIVPRRLQYCLDLKIRLSLKFMNDQQLLNVTERTIFLRRDCGSLDSFEDVGGRDVTHIFANNRVFSAEDNQSIVNALNNTSWKVFAWTLDEKKTLNSLGL